MPDQNGVVELGDFPGLTTSITVDAAGVSTTNFEFSLAPKRFTITGDLFLAVPALPLNIAKAVAGFKDMSGTDADEKLLGFFDHILMDESIPLFRQRASGDLSKTRPIPMPLLMPIINMLLEAYGLRPTQPSADSSSTSASVDGSTPSTDGVSAAESTGPDSPSQDS